ncbi:MAG TPA: hypothetical protein VKA88_04320 [Solirubrobacterales bacterium]|nr:hypothetical protein [Solirubrobacterales bacterium]
MGLIGKLLETAFKRPGYKGHRRGWDPEALPQEGYEGGRAYLESGGWR